MRSAHSPGACQVLAEVHDGGGSSFAFVVLAFAIPFTLLSVPGRTIYDGARHFFFGHPIIAVFAALGVQTALPTLRRAAPPVAMTVALLIGVNLYDLATYHPYQSLYFNRIAGGIQAANGRYETDYWALSYRQAIEWMNGNLTTPARLGMWGTAMAGELFLDRNRFTLTDLSRSPDYFLSITRLHRHLSRTGCTIYRVKLRGISLCVLMKTTWDPTEDRCL